MTQASKTCRRCSTQFCSSSTSTPTLCLAIVICDQRYNRLAHILSLPTTGTVPREISWQGNASCINIYASCSALTDRRTYSIPKFPAPTLDGCGSGIWIPFMMWVLVHRLVYRPRLSLVLILPVLLLTTNTTEAYVAPLLIRRLPHVGVTGGPSCMTYPSLPPNFWSLPLLSPFLFFSFLLLLLQCLGMADQPSFPHYSAWQSALYKSPFSLVPPTMAAALIPCYLHNWLAFPRQVGKFSAA